MRVARFPHHKDFATFDFEATPIDQTRIEQLAIGEFTHQAHNLILIGNPIPFKDGQLILYLLFSKNLLMKNL